MNGRLDVQNGDTLGAIRRLLRAVLASGAVDAVLVPLRHPAGDAVAPALVKDPAKLDLADPLAPVLPVSGARLVSMLTWRAPRPAWRLCCATARSAPWWSWSNCNKPASKV